MAPLIFIILSFLQLSLAQQNAGSQSGTSNKTAKAILVRQFGGPDVLKVEDVPIPQPGENEVLVHNYAAGVNPVDTYIRTGARALSSKLPYVPGLDGAGEIESVGSNVTQFKKGDRVFVYAHHGTYAQYLTVRQDSVFPLPPNITFSQGAAIGVAYFTAYRALFQTVKQKPVKTVLIFGASGGVGLAAVQLAKQASLTVYGTAGSEEGLKVVKDNGADFVFNHYVQEKETEDNIRKAGGIDLILDMVANVNLPTDLRLVSPHGTIVVIGSHGPLAVETGPLMSHEVAILGITLSRATERELAEAGADVVQGLKNGALNPIVDKEYPLENAAQAHEDISGSKRGSKGKLVILTDKKA